jgi:transposase
MNAAEAASRIKELTGIERGITQVKRFMKKQGFCYRKMGHIPAKADRKKQIDWMKETMEPIIGAALRTKYFFRKGTLLMVCTIFG